MQKKNVKCMVGHSFSYANGEYDDNYTCIVRKFVINSVLVIYEISLFPKYSGTRDQKEVRTHEQI